MTTKRSELFGFSAPLNIPHSTPHAITPGYPSQDLSRIDFSTFGVPRRSRRLGHGAKRPEKKCAIRDHALRGVLATRGQRIVSAVEDDGAKQQARQQGVHVLTAKCDHGRKSGVTYERNGWHDGEILTGCGGLLFFFDIRDDTGWLGCRVRRCRSWGRHGKWAKPFTLKCSFCCRCDGVFLFFFDVSSQCVVCVEWLVWVGKRCCIAL